MEGDARRISYRALHADPSEHPGDDVHPMLPTVLHGRDWERLLCEPVHVLSWKDNSHMGKDSQSDVGAAATLQREVCDKCESSMELEGSAHGFERWTCPGCQQVVGIDRDPEVGSRFQIARGQPWNYAPDVFKN
jgi:hypothetical protein